MALSDPQSVTINAIPVSMPRISSGINSGVYASNDGTVALTASHQYGRRNRHRIRLDHSKVAPDPFTTANNIKYSMSTTFIVDVPPTGYTNAEAKQVVDGYIAALSASSGTLITKLLGGEN